MSLGWSFHFSFALPPCPYSQGTAKPSVTSFLVPRDRALILPSAGPKMAITGMLPKNSHSVAKMLSACAMTLWTLLAWKDRSPYSPQGGANIQGGILLPRCFRDKKLWTRELWVLTLLRAGSVQIVRVSSEDRVHRHAFDEDSCFELQLNFLIETSVFRKKTMPETNCILR